MSGELIAKQKGDTVQGYRILQEIGRGAASIVYLVQDPKSKQIWALKHVQKNSPKDQRFLDQAAMEYRVAQAVRSPGVRRIEKMFKTGSILKVKELFVLMELVDGEPLDQYTIPSLPDAVNIFRQVAEGLAAMHDAGYVHADMKPHNVIVGTDFQGGLTSKVIDLGQSCKIGTVKERIQGTPDYIAPEQVHRRAITPQTDVYNFGATMYWCLTRKHIPTAMGTKSDSLMNSLDDALIEEATPAIELNPEIHPKLNTLIMECVRVPVDQRPKSMHDIAGQLDLIYGILRAQAEAAGRGS
ncbi:MAG: serine/threonine-protein kinase [Phycisphaerales bacterium JB040]